MKFLVEIPDEEIRDVTYLAYEDDVVAGARAEIEEAMTYTTFLDIKVSIAPAGGVA